ncbi:MAG TPA: hypothetical protein VIK21_04805, partial [Desulfuromonadaceae bacterium]
MSNLGYPESMFHWLTSQCRLDHFFSQLDACEEKLAFGLYIRSHTIDSLSRELAGVFDVQECMYEEHDPRYLISVVKRKGGFSDLSPAAGNDGGEAWTKQEFRQREGMSIEDVANEIHAICDLLELHAERVERFFLNGGVSGGNSPLSMADTDLSKFIGLLEHIDAMRLLAR